MWLQCSAHREGYRDINALNAETGHLVNSENTIETTNDPWVFNDLVKPPPTNPNLQDEREICKVFFFLTLLENYRDPLTKNLFIL